VACRVHQARPGGNTTGVSILASELDVKRLEVLHEFVPQARRIAVLGDPTTISCRRVATFYDNAAPASDSQHCLGRLESGYRAIGRTVLICKHHAECFRKARPPRRSQPEGTCVTLPFEPADF
jgi:hypothetical protein